MDSETVGTVKISTSTCTHTLVGVGAAEFSRMVKACETCQPFASLTTVDKARTLCLPTVRIMSMAWNEEEE